MNIDISQVITYTADVFGIEPAKNFDEVYARLIRYDLETAQANLDALPENDRRGLAMKTLRHFNCGYLQNWVLTKCRAEFLCGIYVDDLTREPKRLPPPSPRIIIPTSQRHFHATATDSARLSVDKKYWKQHGGKMDGESFNVADALKRDLIVVVEGEIDAMSIWQATQGAVGVVAILGCNNGRKSLLPYVDDLRGKKLLLLLDADEAGKKATKNFLNEISRLGLLAVNRTLYDAMPAADQKEFGNRPKSVDANSLLAHYSKPDPKFGNAYLRGLVERIIEDAEPEFDERRTELDAHNLFVQQNNAEADAQPSTLKKPEPQPSKTSTENRRADVSKLPREEFDLILRDYVHARDLHYNDWHNVATIMREYGYTVEDFKAWSNDGDHRYDEKSCESTWKPTRANVDKPVTVATLIHYAQENGYKPNHAAVDGEARRDELIDFLFTGDGGDRQFAKRLEAFCGDRVRWLTDDERWVTYGDGVWTRGSEKNAAISTFADELAETMQQRAATDYEKKLADKFQSSKKIGCAIGLLKGRTSVRITAKDLDNHPELLNVLNGVVDLQTGELREAAPELLLTRQAGAAFDPEAQSPLVEEFFKAIQPDVATRAGLLRWLGYCLTSETREHKFAVWTGRSGANGKSTLSDVMLELLGTYGTGLNPRALLKTARADDADRATTALNPLENRRAAFVDELPLNALLDSALVKNLSGGGKINLRPNYNEYRTVANHAKIIISGNFMPRIENTADGGLERRLLNFAFNVKFGTADHPADPQLKDKLILPENLRGLLALLVREAVAWYRDGLIISDAMKAETQRILDESNFVADFISDYYVKVPTAEIKAKDFIDELKREYPRECSQFNKRADLIRLITAQPGVSYGKGSHNVNVFKGIGKAARDDFGGEPIDQKDTPF